MWPLIGLIKSLGCFLGFLGQNGLKIIFLVKKQKTLFFWSSQWPGSKDEQTCPLLI
jgi:hypothetical protein